MTTTIALTDTERAYLQNQPLGRLATVDRPCGSITTTQFRAGRSPMRPCSREARAAAGAKSGVGSTS